MYVDMLSGSAGAVPRLDWLLGVRQEIQSFLWLINPVQSCEPMATSSRYPAPAGRWLVNQKLSQWMVEAEL